MCAASSLSDLQGWRDKRGRSSRWDNLQDLLRLKSGFSSCLVVWLWIARCSIPFAEFVESISRAWRSASSLSRRYELLHRSSNSGHEKTIHDRADKTLLIHDRSGDSVQYKNVSSTSQLWSCCGNRRSTVHIPRLYKQVEFPPRTNGRCSSQGIALLHHAPDIKGYRDRSENVRVCHELEIEKNIATTVPPSQAGVTCFIEMVRRGACTIFDLRGDIQAICTNDGTVRKWFRLTSYWPHRFRREIEGFGRGNSVDIKLVEHVGRGDIVSVSDQGWDQLRICRKCVCRSNEEMEEDKCIRRQDYREHFYSRSKAVTNELGK